MHTIVLATSKRAKKKRCYYLNVQLVNEQKKTLLLFKCATSKRAKKMLLLFKCATSKRAKKIRCYYLNVQLANEQKKNVVII